MAKKGMDYFESFTVGVEYGCRAAALLRDCFDHYDPAQLPQRMAEMHQVEHSADNLQKLHTILMETVI